MKNVVLAGIGAVAVFAPVSVLADITIDIGGGWQATIRDEDNVQLQINVIDFDNNRIILQKFAKFFKVDADGNPLPQNIVFEQIAPDDETISRFFIDEMHIFNGTQVDWIGFEERLLGDDVSWDQALSAGFAADIDPFTTMDFFTPNGHTDIITFGGGVVPADAQWNPGDDSGALVINVDLSQDGPVKFILRETPIVPAPAAGALLAAAILGRRRRR
jgi:hypothetical protein